MNGSYAEDLPGPNGNYNENKDKSSERSNRKGAGEDHLTGGTEQAWRVVCPRTEAASAVSSALGVNSPRGSPTPRPGTEL